MSVFDNISKITGIKEVFQIDDHENPYDVVKWHDTGIPMLNAVLSDGDIFKGLPDGKRILISGEPSTAKSFFQVLIVSSYLINNPTAKIICFESEGSSIADLCRKIGIPKDKIKLIAVSTIEQTKMAIGNILIKIEEQHQFADKRNLEIEKENKKIDKENKKIDKENKDKKSKDKKPLIEKIKLEEKEKYIFVLDSLGMLTSEVELSNIAKNKNVEDLKRSKAIRSFTRSTVLKFSAVNCPFIIINHVYESMDVFKTKNIAGGHALVHFVDISLMLEKQKDYDETEKKYKGIIVKVKVHKSRFMKENHIVKIVLDFKKGIYKWSGLLDLGEKLNVIKKIGHSYVFPDGSSVKSKEVVEKFASLMNETNLNALGKAIKDEFGFGDMVSVDNYINEKIEVENQEEKFIEGFIGG